MTVRFELPPVSSVRWGSWRNCSAIQDGDHFDSQFSEASLWGARHDLAGCQLHAFEENSGAARADAVRGESLHDLVESADPLAGRVDERKAIERKGEREI